MCEIGMMNMLVGTFFLENIKSVIYTRTRVTESEPDLLPRGWVRIFYILFKRPESKPL